MRRWKWQRMDMSKKLHRRRRARSPLAAAAAAVRRRRWGGHRRGRGRLRAPPASSTVAPGGRATIDMIPLEMWHSSSAAPNPGRRARCNILKCLDLSTCRKHSIGGGRRGRPWPPPTRCAAGRGGGHRRGGRGASRGARRGVFHGGPGRQGHRGQDHMGDVAFLNRAALESRATCPA